MPFSLRQNAGLYTCGGCSQPKEANCRYIVCWMEDLDQGDSAAMDDLLGRQRRTGLSLVLAFVRVLSA